MNYEVIKKLGTLIEEKDVYDGCIYLYSNSYWVYGNALYIRTKHSNANRYTGKTGTICFIRDIDKEFMTTYSIDELLQVGMSNDGIKRLQTMVKSQEIPTSAAISEARVKSGLTLTEACALFEIPQRTFISWESGERTPPKWAEKLIIEKLERLQDND